MSGAAFPSSGDTRVMRTLRHIAPLVLTVPLAFATEPAQAQRTQDSSAVPAAAPPWRDSVRCGGGPSVGAPPSDYNGEKPPAMWCLQATGRAAGDLGRSGDTWERISRSWLRQVLSDTTDFGMAGGRCSAERRGWRPETASSR